jgi:hypothetical protein
MGIKKVHTGENTQLGGFWISIPSWVVKHIKGDSVALHVLTCAIVYMNTHDQTLSTTYDVLARDTGYNRRTVIRAMHRLVEIGVIRKTVKMGRYGKNMPNVYVITYNTAAAEALLNGGDSRDTGGLSSVSSDTTGVTPETLILSDSSVTQIRENNNTKNEKSKKASSKKLTQLDLYSTDTRWAQQLRVNDRRV